MKNACNAVRHSAQKPIKALPDARTCVNSNNLFRRQDNFSRRGPRVRPSIDYERILRQGTGLGSKGMVAFASEAGSVRAADVDQDRTLWMRSASTLALGALGPNLTLAALSEKVGNTDPCTVACVNMHCQIFPSGVTFFLDSCCEQILSLEHWQIAGLLFVTDCIFVATSFKFLQIADDFDRDWHKSRKRYPGTQRKHLLCLIGLAACCA